MGKGTLGLSFRICVVSLYPYPVHPFPLFECLEQVCKRCYDSRGVLLGNLGGGVRPASENPYPIPDQNI